MMWTSCGWIPGAEPSTSFGRILSCALMNIAGWIFR